MPPMQLSPGPECMQLCEALQDSLPEGPAFSLEARLSICGGLRWPLFSSSSWHADLLGTTELRCWAREMVTVAFLVGKLPLSSWYKSRLSSPETWSMFGWGRLCCWSSSNLSVLCKCARGTACSCCSAHTSAAAAAPCKAQSGNQHWLMLTDI